MDGRWPGQSLKAFRFPERCGGFPIASEITSNRKTGIGVTEGYSRAFAGNTGKPLAKAGSLDSSPPFKPQKKGMVRFNEPGICEFPASEWLKSVIWQGDRPDVAGTKTTSNPFPKTTRLAGPLLQECLDRQLLLFSMSFTPNTSNSG